MKFNHILLLLINLVHQKALARPPGTKSSLVIARSPSITKRFDDEFSTDSSLGDPTSENERTEFEESSSIDLTSSSYLNLDNVGIRGSDQNTGRPFERQFVDNKHRQVVKVLQ